MRQPVGTVWPQEDSSTKQSLTLIEDAAASTVLMCIHTVLLEYGLYSHRKKAFHNYMLCDVRLI